MTKWLPVNEAELPKVEKTSRGGSKTVISESPFNIPEFLRLDFEQGARRLVLEFRYLGDAAEVDEPVKQNRLSPNFCVFDGKISHRIYKIELSNFSNIDEQLVPTIESIIRDFDKCNVRPKTLGRYQVLIDAWKKLGKSLVIGLKSQFEGLPVIRQGAT